MAGAAAKKAAAARAAAASFYRPFLLVSTGLYMLIRIYRLGLDVDVKGFLGMTALGGLQYYSYIGILDNAQNRSSSDKSLVGGASLDLLAVVLVVQFGSILVSPKFYWLLIALPPWGAWSLYKTFYGDRNKASPPPEDLTAEDKSKNEKAAEKRKKRAERRQKKWS